MFSHGRKNFDAQRGNLGCFIDSWYIISWAFGVSLVIGNRYRLSAEKPLNADTALLFEKQCRVMTPLSSWAISLFICMYTNLLIVLFETIALVMHEGTKLSISLATR